MAELKQNFIYISSNTGAEKFKENHIGDSITEEDDYYKKITFLKDTGEIATHGQLFGSGVTVDNTQFQLSTSAKYQLAMNNGQISIVRYDPITLSISGLSNVEIDSTVAEKTITPTVGGSNKSTATISWTITGGKFKDGENEVTSLTTTGSSTVTVKGISSATSCTVTASATDGTTNANNKTTSLSFIPRVMWGWSASEITDTEITSTNVSGYSYSVQSSRSLTNKSVVIGEGGGYIYYASSTGDVATNKMFVNSGSAKAPLAGGWLEVGTFTKYTSSEKTYKLYRTANKQAAGTYRIDVD